MEDVITAMGKAGAYLYQSGGEQQPRSDGGNDTTIKVLKEKYTNEGLL